MLHHYCIVIISVYNTEISRDSVATRLMCGGYLNFGGVKLYLLRWWLNLLNSLLSQCIF